jgi:tRNA (guanine-N7-)-methyltransferase
MSKKKLIRFKANKDFDRLFEPAALDLIEQDHELKGKWCEQFFNNDNELLLELGCGRGEYTIGLARLNPDKNYIGVDIKGSRLFFGATRIKEEQLKNAGLVRSQIELLPNIFAQEVSEIWITFPDPFPGRIRRRLTAPNFLNRYRKILREDGNICLKTDDADLYEFTLDLAQKNHLEVLDHTNDLYASPLKDKMPPIQTLYEEKFIAAGKKICFLRFRLDRDVTPLKPKIKDSASLS